MRTDVESRSRRLRVFSSDVAIEVAIESEGLFA